MTKRISVSTVQNLWSDAQQVDKNDLDTEQENKNQNFTSITNNFFGSGVLLETPSSNVILDTDLLNSTQASLVVANNFDGTGISPNSQPTDVNLGNQITIELTGSDAFGRLSSKVAIIGLSFDNQLISEKFYFYTNEKQTTRNHYKKILTILFNDFKGNNNCSRDLGGRFVIRESHPFELSRDAKSVFQDIEPDIFWRDFKVSDPTKGLYTTIQEAIGPEYNADSLQINITGRQPSRVLPVDNVTTRIGQKFSATTDNIQKVTLLLGVQRNGDGYDRFDWSGDIVISINTLQTTVDCPSDIIPDLAIEFDPDPIPIVEISFSQEELFNIGYVLTDVAQPIDFVFTNTKISKSKAIVPGNYYTITIRRSGNADGGTIFAEVGNNRINNSRLTVFNGVWVDSTDEDMWFQVWSDAAKLSDGKGYDCGTGIQYDKTTTDSNTGAIVDNQINNLSFVNTGSNTLNNGIIQAAINEFLTVQDERTGNPVNSRKEFIPSFSFVLTGDLNSLQETSEPFIVGCAADQNPKTINTILGTQNLPGLVKGDTFTIVNPAPDFLSQNLIGRRLIPEQTCTAFSYRIFRSTLCVDGYGDVLGNGTIDQNDVNRASELIGESLSLASTQQKISDGIINTLELIRADVDGDGTISANDVDLIQQFVDRDISSFPVGTSFNHLELQVQNDVGRYDGYFDCNGLIRLDGYGGDNIIDPNMLTPVERNWYGNPTIPSIDGDNSVFDNVPFAPVQFSIEYISFWQPYLLSFTSKSKTLPQTFTNESGIQNINCEPDVQFICTDRTVSPVFCDPGRNDFYIPNNLIIGDGQIIRPDGSQFKVDVEVGTVILELPAVQLNENIIDVYRSFVVDRGDGLTNAGFRAMRYSDCSSVQAEDLSLQRVRFSVSLQSFVPDLDGYTLLDGYGVVVNEGIGLFIDQSTGLLTITVSDLVDSSILNSLVTKIQIQVFLKKAGWNNPVLTVSPDQVIGLLIT